MLTSLEAKTELINLLDNNIVYASIRHVLPSGMSRIIDFCIIKDNCSCWLSGYISEITGFQQSKKDRGLRVHGCGMDMAYHVVSTLSEELYGDHKILKSDII